MGGLTDVVCGPSGVVAVAPRSVDGSAAISLWSLADGRYLRDLQGHVGEIKDLAFSPDGKRLLSCATEFRAIVWNVDSGRELLTFRDHPDAVLAGAWSADGRRIATLEKFGGLRVWQGPATGAAEATWTALYQNDFADPAASAHWQPSSGSTWEVKDGVLHGTQVLVKKPVEYSIASADLKGVKLSKHVDITFRYRMSKPMTVSVTLANPTGDRQSFSPLLAAPCRLVGSPMAFLIRVTGDGMNPGDIVPRWLSASI